MKCFFWVSNISTPSQIDDWLVLKMLKFSDIGWDDDCKSDLC